MEAKAAKRWIMTMPLCRSVFPSMYQYEYEMQYVLRTAVITSFISRCSSV